jgi:Sec-independent protein secretion pathway component TatC
MRNRTKLEKLERNRAFVLILAFIVSTFVETLVHWHGPPDALFMSTLACSIYLLFEVGLFFARLFRRR